MESENKKITEKQIKFVEQLKRVLGYKEKFYGELKDMAAEKASKMIEKMLYTRNKQRKSVAI